MATLREETEFHRLALAMALTDVNAAVAWADQIIAELPEPAIQVLEVALAGNRSAGEVIDLLALVPGDGDLTNVAHRVLGLFLERFGAGTISSEIAVDMLWAYHNWARIPEDERLRAANFRDELFCAEQGYYGTLESVRQGILRFSSRFAV